MKNTTLLRELETHHNKFKNAHKSLETFNRDIEFYEKFIPYFFSKNGDADNIKNVYENITYDYEDGCEKTISCINVNKCYDVYKETWLDGMYQFISDIRESSDDNLENLSRTLTIAEHNNPVFLTGLYNGEVEECPIEEMPLSEAVSNIEFLIDFIPQLSLLKEECLHTVNTIVNGDYSKDKQNMLIESLNLLYNSIDDYCYGTLKNILEDYDKINTALFESTESSHTNKEKEEPFVLL
jgi:hypothetical protein